MFGKLARIPDGVRKMMGSVALAAYRRPYRTLLLVGLLTLVAALGGRRLSIDADLAALLPESFESVRELERLQARFGGIGYVVVVAHGAAPEQLERFAEQAGPRLERLPDVRYVNYRRPVRFLEDHALYFLAPGTLATIRQRLSSRLAWERRHGNPLYIDLEGSPPPSLDFSDLVASGQEAGSWAARQLGEPYYLDRDRRLLALLVKPAGLATSYDRAQRVYDQVRGAIQQMDLEPYGPDLRISYTGRYVKRVDQQSQVRRDLQVTSVASVGLVLLYLAFYFRSLTGVVLVIAPLAASLGWSYGFAGLAFGQLNILTAFMGSILLGMGIDYAIHFLSRFGLERQTAGDEDAIRRTFADTGLAVILSSATTVAAFGVLGFSRFRAFREFGLIAAAGMFFAVLACAVLLPALLRLLPLPLRPPLPTRSPVRGWASRPGRALLLFTAVTFLAVLHLPQLRFNYDFAALEDSRLPSYQLDREVNRLLGYSQTPAVVLTDSPAQEEAVTAALRARRQALGEASTVDMVASLTDLVPSGQAEKQAILREIAALLDQVRPARLEAGQRAELARAKRMARAAPFELQDLPPELRRQFQGSGPHAQGGFVLVFPRVSLSDGLQTRAFAREVRGVALPDGGTVSATGEAMLMADILEMVSREAPVMLAATLGTVLLVLFLFLGNARDTALAAFTPALTLSLGFGILAALGLELNYLNIALIPVLFGLAEDGGVHLLIRIREGLSLSEAYAEIAGPVGGSILTSGIGFGALALADHSGLWSFGVFALIGMTANLLATLFGLPSFLSALGIGGAAPASPETVPDCRLRQEH